MKIDRKERPKLRKIIYGLTFFENAKIGDLCNGFYIDEGNRQVFVSDGIRTQARKIKQELHDE